MKRKGEGGMSVSRSRAGTPRSHPPPSRLTLDDALLGPWRRWGREVLPIRHADHILGIVPLGPPQAGRPPATLNLEQARNHTGGGALVRKVISARARPKSRSQTTGRPPPSKHRLSSSPRSPPPPVSSLSLSLSLSLSRYPAMKRLHTGVRVLVPEGLPSRSRC